MHAPGRFYSVATRYGVALLAVTLASIIRLRLDNAFGDYFSTTTYFIAVLFTARFGGAGPSAVALLLGFMAADAFFIPPRGSLFGYGPEHQFELYLYFALSGLTVVLSGSLYSARVKAQAETRDAVEQQCRLQEDIDYRLAIEDALRESEHRYRTVAEELQTVNRRKDEFLAMLGHELRNPLAPISSALSLLQLGDVEAALQTECYDIMQRHIKQLTRIVDDLLDVSRIMQGKITLKREHVDLRMILSQSLETCQPLINQLGHQVRTSLPECPAPVNVDPVRLTQVIVNLVNNAAKYTLPNGTITLRLSLEADEVLLEIADNGTGIDPLILPKVFDLFTQADRSLDRSAGGLGVGLTVVKNLVEMHGGTVIAASGGIGRGSTFSVRLQLAPVSSESPEGKAIGGSSAPLRVLLIEDNVEAAHMFAALLLRAWGHGVYVAHDGISGLELAATENFDIVFVDIGLPGLNGYEVARRLRRYDGSSERVLIAITGYGQEEDRRCSQAAGFDLHLVKPASVESLEAAFSHPKVAARTAVLVDKSPAIFIEK